MFYGGDYNPEQWPEEVWLDDARRMVEGWRARPPFHRCWPVFRRASRRRGADRCGR